MTSPLAPGRDPRGGFSLVEPVVALVLLGIGLTGPAGTLVLATRIHSSARVLEEGIARAGELADSLRDAGGGRGEEAGAGWTLEWDVPGDGWGWLEVRPGGQGGEVEGRGMRLEVRVVAPAVVGPGVTP